jgi:hypothetical protein
VLLPWTYVRVLAPRSQNGPAGTTQDVEEEEREAYSFANILISLEMFTATIPKGVNEMKLCISCGDRLNRDALVCVIRTLAIGLGPTLSVEARINSLPWRTNSDYNGKESYDNENRNDSSAKDSDTASTVAELRTIIEKLESENALLKLSHQDEMRRNQSRNTVSALIDESGCSLPKDFGYDMINETGEVINEAGASIATEPTTKQQVIFDNDNHFELSQ